MTLNAVLTMTKNVGWNSLYSVGSLAAGGGTAYIISKIAHSSLKPKTAEFCSNTLQATATFIGMAVSLYLLPRAEIVGFTANQTLKLIALNATLHVASCFGHKTWAVILINYGTALGCGSTMAGFYGAPALAAFGGAGALLGALWGSNVKGTAKAPTTLEGRQSYGTRKG